MKKNCREKKNENNQINEKRVWHGEGSQKINGQRYTHYTHTYIAFVYEEFPHTIHAYTLTWDRENRH